MQSQSTVWVGTSGYSFEDWKGPFYRTSIRQGDMLPFYASQFETVELNYSFYRLPYWKTSEAMQKKVPEGFLFFAKLFQGVTHEGDISSIPKFKLGLQPFVDAGTLKSLVVQFPQSFHYTEKNSDYMLRVFDALADYRISVEFRHRSWFSPDVNETLRERKVSLITVDVPDIPALYPSVPLVTGDIGYVRLHSRNAENWYGTELRYDYNYSEEELKECLSLLETISKSTKNIFMFFNNCENAQAALNARRMKEIIQNDSKTLKCAELNRGVETIKGGLWA